MLVVRKKGLISLRTDDRNFFLSFFLAIDPIGICGMCVGGRMYDIGMGRAELYISYIFTASGLIKPISVCTILPDNFSRNFCASVSSHDTNH